MCTRVVHSFTCAGILLTQHLKFSMFAGMGRVGHKYMEKGNVYHSLPRSLASMYPL